MADSKKDNIQNDNNNVNGNTTKRSNTKDQIQVKHNEQWWFQMIDVKTHLISIQK